MRSYKIAVIPGDGIGPDVVEIGMNIMQKAAETHGFKIVFLFIEAFLKCIPSIPAQKNEISLSSITTESAGGISSPAACQKSMHI